MNGEKKKQTFINIGPVKPNESYIGEDTITYIEKTGLPITKDGLLKMDEEGEKAILSALNKSIQRDKDICKEKSNQKPENSNQTFTISIKEATKAAISSGIILEDIREIDNKKKKTIEPEPTKQTEEEL